MIYTIGKHSFLFIISDTGVIVYKDCLWFFIRLFA